jgi:predicted dehydrogenase
VDQVRLGIIGLGNMGNGHLALSREIATAKLSAVCDIDPKRLEERGKPTGVPCFATADELIASKTCDAVVIATPHYDHVPIGIAALRAGLHVLVEKPIAVSVKAARELIAESLRHPHLKFGIMYNQRSNPLYQKLRALIAAGELGEIFRITWIITDWFRTHAYYASGGWRATWAGEGGGVLINQCPHNLDLIQWITGLNPHRVTAVGSIGKRHPIEVEDDVSAILEYPNGAVGHFITTTGEAPGTNRLEIAGDRGKFIAENGKLTFVRTTESVTEVNSTSPNAFHNVESWTIDIPYPKAPPIGEHHRVMINYLDAILKDTPMLSPGVDGIHGLEIGNAMLMSGITRKPVDIPVDGEAFDLFIADMIKTYGGRKTLATREAVVDMAASSSSFR